MDIGYLNDYSQRMIKASIDFPDLTSIIKALLLNSLRAQSDYIEIHVDEGIEIRDNGRGFSSEKLETLDSNSSLRTLSQISTVDVISKNRECFKYTINTDAFKRSDSLRKTGSIVKISNIFHNIPVRKLRIEPHMIITGLEPLILSAYWSTFHIYIFKSSVLSFKRSERLKERILDVFGVEKLKHVQYIGSFIQIDGYFDKQLSYHLHHQYLLYKNKPIECVEIANRINSVFFKTLKTEWKKDPGHLKRVPKYPKYALNIIVPGSSIDLSKNLVILSKIEVLRELTMMLSEQLLSQNQTGKEVCDALVRQITTKKNKTLLAAPQTFSLFGNISDEAVIHSLSEAQAPRESKPTETKPKFKVIKPSNIHPQQLTPILPDQLKTYKKPSNHNITIQKKNKPMFTYTDFCLDTFKIEKIITQFQNKFILGAISNGKQQVIAAFDQHACDERVQLERLEKKLRDDLNTVNAHISLSLNSYECSLLASHQNRLKEWGFNYEVQDNQVFVSSLPQLYGKTLTFDDLIQTAHSSDVIPPCINNAMKLKACRTAVKFGDMLDLFQCIDLCNNLINCKNPLQCAHGRPTVYPLASLNSLVMKPLPPINFNKKK